MSRRRRPVRILVLTLAMVVGLTASLSATEGWVAAPVVDDDGISALLVLGSDQGPPRSGTVLNGRADAIHLLVVDAEQEHVSIMSFPRDAYVPVRGFGTTKINAMLTRGAENAVGTMEDLTGITIDDWIVTGFDAMIIGVDAFGGVHLDVEQRLLDNASQTDLQPGYQRLTGWKALAYTRDRHSRPDGDVGRSTGQANVLMAMHRELIDDTTSPSRLIDFAAILRQHTVSSISADQMIRLGALALRIDPANVAAVTMPGSNGFAGDAAIYRLANSAYAIMEDVRTDGRLSVFDESADEPATDDEG